MQRLIKSEENRNELKEAVRPYYKYM